METIQKTGPGYWAQLYWVLFTPGAALNSRSAFIYMLWSTLAAAGQRQGRAPVFATVLRRYPPRWASHWTSPVAIPPMLTRGTSLSWAFSTYYSSLESSELARASPLLHFLGFHLLGDVFLFAVWNLPVGKRVLLGGALPCGIPVEYSNIPPALTLWGSPHLLQLSPPVLP